MIEDRKYGPAQAEVLRIGATRIAYWTGRSESAVYKWLRRRPSETPIPPEHLPAVAKGARADGVTIDLRLLWPEGAEMAEAA